MSLAETASAPVTPASPATPTEVSRHFLRSLEASRLETWPYNHWVLADMLPEAVGDGIAALPFDPPAIADTAGRRETHNSTRTYADAPNRARFPACEALARGFQDPAVTGAIAARCGTSLAGTNLRIEYCQDTEGFWLEPHTDIGVKKFTMLIYLSKDRGSEGWGTDVLDADHNLVHSAPYKFNCGLIFIPGTDTWHGFHRRPIAGVRKSIIINYVGPEWRARHELAFPDQPIA
jgi:hypothetical protein